MTAATIGVPLWALVRLGPANTGTVIAFLWDHSQWDLIITAALAVVTPLLAARAAWGHWVGRQPIWSSIAAATASVVSLALTALRFPRIMTAPMWGYAGLVGVCALVLVYSTTTLAVDRKSAV